MALFSVLLLSAVLLAGAGQQPAPSLQSRANTPPSDEHPVVTLVDGAKSLLPEDASGLYRFGDPGTGIGEGIQIDEQFGDVTGYLTIKSTSSKAIGAYFFSRVEGGNGKLSFTTKAVHGLYYSFEGTVTRGQGLSRAQDGFYRMQGELLAHDDTQQTTQRRTVDLKLTGRR